MQAAMLVVAWYVRDRINRRRRRSRKHFKRGLKAAASTKARVPRGETVRKWVLAVPEGCTAMSPNNPVRDTAKVDKEEIYFDVEREPVPDKDEKLFGVADNLIRGQLAKIDVPLLGALDLDVSDSESEGENDEDPDDLDMEEYDDDEDDEEYEDDDITEDYEADVGEGVSQEALNGTGKGSLKRKRSTESESVGFSKKRSLE